MVAKSLAVVVIIVKKQFNVIKRVEVFLILTNLVELKGCCQAIAGRLNDVAVFKCQA